MQHPAVDISIILLHIFRLLANSSNRSIFIYDVKTVYAPCMFCIQRATAQLISEIFASRYVCEAK